MLKILNLGCGTKVSQNVINIDWSIYLKLKKNSLLSKLARLILPDYRAKKLDALPSNVVVHNLSKGIPFPDDSIDAIYHSHFLEHIDRDGAENFLREVKRVLKPEGIQRIVVPDLEIICRNYLDHLNLCYQNSDERKKHDDYIYEIIGMCVMKEAYSTRIQKPALRFLENLLLGDARKRGITHQWMYDRVNLSVLLEDIGYREIKTESYNSSSIPDWNSYGLDIDQDGNEYKPGSIYLEAKK